MVTKERRKRNSTPFVSRLLKRMEAVGKIGVRLEKHAKKENDEAAQDLATAMIKASRLAATFVEGKPKDWRPAGSGVGKAVPKWEGKEKVKLQKEYGFLFPNLKPDKEYKVTEIQKLGKGRGSKTYLKLNDPAETFVQASQVQRVEA